MTVQKIDDSQQPVDTSAALQNHYLVHTLRALGSLLRDIVPSLLNAVSLIILSGYLIVHAYIHRYSSLPLINVSLSQYLAAGLGFFVIATTIPSVIIGVILGIPAIIMLIYMAFLVAGFTYRKRRVEAQEAKRLKTYEESLKKAITRQDKSKLTDSMVDETFADYKQSLKIFDRSRNALEVFENLFSRAQKPAGLLFLIIYFIIVVIGSPIYGDQSYGKTDYILGGAKPVDVVVVFKEESRKSDWPFVVNPNTGRSQKLKLLLQLTDGILVWDETAKIASQIKDDAILGILDYSFQTPTQTGPNAPAPTLSPTSTP